MQFRRILVREMGRCGGGCSKLALSLSTHNSELSLRKIGLTKGGEAKVNFLTWDRKNSGSAGKSQRWKDTKIP